MTQPIYLAEITAYDPVAAAEVTLRYSSGLGYSGTGAPGYYEPRILQPALLQRTAFAGGTTAGVVETGYGALTLVNIDGGLDALIDYGFDGRLIRILIGQEAAAYSTFAPLFVGTMEQPRFSIATAEFLIRDRLFEFDRQLQATKFAGTNVLPAGLEGVADIEGQPKPKAFGISRNVAPPMVNTALLVVQLSDGEIDAAEVYDNGVALTPGVAYADATDMLTNAPSPGGVRVLSSSAGSYARLGASPAGQITADVTQGATSADRTAGQLLYQIATGPGGLDPADIEAADVTALDSANSAECGWWFGQETTVREAMVILAESVGAWFGFDRLGKLRMRRLEAPSGSPVITFRRLDSTTVADATTVDIIEMERVTSEDQGRGVPTYRVRLDYQPNHTVQSDGLGGGVTAARREFLRSEYRTVTATDSAVLTKHLLAPEIAFRTALDAAADAQAECARRLALYKVRRDRLDLQAPLDTALAETIDIGSTVAVQTDRFGYGAGRLFVVLGLQPDAAAKTVKVELWG